MRDLALPQILAANDAYTAGFDAPARTPRPSRNLVVVTCMDARLDLFRALGLQVGDSHLLRNAGGRVTDDVIRSLLLSSHALDTREFGVIHHTNCGLEGSTNEQLHERTGATDVDFMPFDDVAASVVEDVERLRARDGFPDGSVVWGAVYDVDTGRVSVVAEPVEL